jgi:hypothetical protein
MTARLPILMAWLAAAAAAQTPVAPTPQAAGERLGENVSNYNIVNNFETGYRFSSVGGNLAQYRSSVNFGNGIRLLGSLLSVNSRDGHGAFFDQIVLTTQGLGNDPYEAAMLHVEKNRLYRYDLSWRQNDYFNPGLVTAGGGGQHLLDTRYRMQDHDFTLFPQSNLKFFLGMSASSQTGPSLSSTQLFNASSPVTPLFSDVQRVWREYRVGNEFRLMGIRVNWMHGWEDFKDDTGATLTAPSPPLTSFGSSNPYHGTSPYWRAAIFTDRKVFNVNGRFTYTGGRRAFVVDESSAGKVAAGVENRQVTTFGNAERPVATGNLNVSFTPGSKLTVMNATSVYNVRTLGNSFFSQVDNVTGAFTFLNYNYLGILTIANDTDLSYQISSVWGVMAGYHYTDRRIQSVEQTVFAGKLSATPSEQTNLLHAGDLGLRVKPWKPVTVQVSGEIGRADRPFTPKADKDYHVLNGRFQYKLKRVQFTAAANANYNVNSTSLTAYSSQARTYAFAGSWTPGPWLTLDAGFTRLHLHTIGGIEYFLNQKPAPPQDSVYLSNINTGYFGARIALRNRADLYLGYTRVQDLGDGRSAAQGPGIGSPLAIFQVVQTFPMVYQSPVARVSVRIKDKLRWNAGYQYYGYRQDFFFGQDYRAHTGFTSLSVSF